MRDNWIFFPNLDIEGGCNYKCPTDYNILPGFASHILSHFGSLVDLSFNCSNSLVSTGNSAFQETYSCFSKFAGAFIFWHSSRPYSNISCKFSRKPRGSRNRQSPAPFNHVSSILLNPAGIFLDYGSEVGNDAHVFFSNIARATMGHLRKQVEQNKDFPLISIAAALIPPFDNLYPKTPAECIPVVANSDGLISGKLTHSLTETECRDCLKHTMPKIDQEHNATEPQTGIKFPTVLDASLVQDNPDFISEVLVGIGSRTMKIIKIKTLKVYAFGLYIHPDSVCAKLGPKYGSIPANELKDRSEFYEDLLREDIPMSVRLVVNCNGVKFNTVRDAFEKSLRNRLQKMNPNTDYHCIKAFGSHFKQDIALPRGTTISFRQTADGELITEIGGKTVGAVHSKDLCKAFFDMYIGDGPVSVQAKEDIAENVADLIRRC